MTERFYVYTHSLPNGTVFYVGLGHGQRAYSRFSRNKFWYAIVNKYCKPNKFIVNIVANNLTRDEACELEKTLIWYYGRRELGLGTLVNLTDGGDVPEVGPTTRQKLSEVSKRNWSNPEYRKKCTESAKRKWQNPEIKEKYSIIQKKRFANPEQRRKASEANKNNPKVRQAAAKGAEAVRGKPAWNQGIPASEEIKQKQSKAAKLRYQNPKEKEKVIAALEKARMVKFSKPYEFKERPNRNKPFICHQNGKTYKNLQEAALDLNLQKSKICLVLKGKRTQTGSFTFSYVESK